MKNSITCSIVLALAISSFTTVIPKDKPSAWQKVKTFLSKHKRKITAGITAAAILGITVGLAYHGNKTRKAIEAAGIQPDNDEYDTAIIAVGLLGPLGEQKAIQVIQLGVQHNIISRNQAIVLVTSNVGSALAHYWGISHAKFMLDTGYSGFKETLKGTWRDCKEGISNLKNVITK